MTIARRLCLALAALSLLAAFVGVLLPVAEVRFFHTPVPIDIIYPSYFSDVTGLDGYRNNWPVTDGKWLVLLAFLMLPAAAAMAAFRRWRPSALPMLVVAIALFFTWRAVGFDVEATESDSGVDAILRTEIALLVPLAAALATVASLLWLVAGLMRRT